MSTQATLVLPDSAAANHNFVAAGVENGVARWLEQTSAYVGGWFEYTSSISLPKKPSEPVRHKFKFRMPTVATETINGVTYQKVTRQSLVTIDAIIPADSTSAERQDLTYYLTALMSSATPGKIGYSIYNRDPVV